MTVRDRTVCFRALTRLVVNTLRLAIGCRFRGRDRVIYAKAEYLNFTGSIKDRMALHILRHAGAEGLLRPGAPVVEATSGNTGIAFAAIGSAIGHPVRIFMPDWMSQERKDLIRSFGADIRWSAKRKTDFSEHPSARGSARLLGAGIRSGLEKPRKARQKSRHSRLGGGCEGDRALSCTTSRAMPPSLAG